MRRASWIRWLLGVSLAVATILVASQVYLHFRYTAAYAEVHKGDSYESVVQRFGTPSLEEPCPRFDPQRRPGIDLSSFYSDCAKRIWYRYALSYADFGAWLIEFDEHNRVSDKEFVISP